MLCRTHDYRQPLAADSPLYTGYVEHLSVDVLCCFLRHSMMHGTPEMQWKQQMASSIARSSEFLAMFSSMGLSFPVNTAWLEL